MPDIHIPTYDQMMNPTLQALRQLGGSATIGEIYQAVAEVMELSEELLQVLHDPERSSQSEVEYRLAWTRTYLKKVGLLENSSRGVWALTTEGRDAEWVDEREIVRIVREMEKQKSPDESPHGVVEEEPDLEDAWREQLMGVLLQMEPSAFERLIQRVLRESGFVQVEVTGRSGDGGIDGTGIIRLGGLLSFGVLFQCKRWQGSIGSSIVRDFRGAMVGRADKGLIVTTGSFTKDAKSEATRDGAPAIDLVDGEQLLDLLKQLGLGVKTEIIQTEAISVIPEWYAGI